MKNRTVWWLLIPVLATAILGWGAWATVMATDATPRLIHDKDIKEIQEIIREQQTETIDRLEKIWERIK